ncbi:hypothetical protein NE865_15017 [Phthorimaea operculella]|nr:hypothetical protein NE865_15017 [Phthorimaea operculella]
MVRVVTQETYDEVVKENMEEFDMSPEEAIKEAVAQFEAQGVDLSNVIKDLALGSGDGHLVSSAVEKLKNFGTNASDDEILKQLEVLKAECKKDIAHRIRAGKDGAYKVLVDLLEVRHKIYSEHKSEGDRKFLLDVLCCMAELMDTQPDLLDGRGVDLIISLLEHVKDEEILIATLKWMSHCCFKHEMNKQALFNKNIAERFKNIILNNKNPKVLSECLSVIRKFTLDDDVRVEFGKAHEHSRDIGILLLEPLTEMLKENTKPPLVSELMLTIATLLVRHELCKMVADCGVNSLFTVLADNYENVATITQANKL